MYGGQRLTPNFLVKFASAVTTSPNNGRDASAIERMDGHGDVGPRRDLLAKHSIVESINEDYSWLYCKHLARYVLCQGLSKRRYHDTLPLGRYHKQGIKRCFDSYFAQRQGQNIALR